MSKFDVDQGNRDLEEAGKPPAWVAEHLRLYRTLPARMFDFRGIPIFG
jgi:hypothetical protein